VLLRDGKSMEYIETSFFENGIPFYTLGGKNFFRRTEVRALYNLLEVVLDPYNLRAMVGFLLSPFVNMDVEEILEMKRSGNLFDVLKERKYRVAELLIELNALKNTIDASEIIKIAMERTNFLGKIALEQDGDKRVANVLKFIEIVNSLDVPSWDVRGIQRIIDRTLDENESEASELSESENVVRIMTVHRAKGLEFPVVIIGQMAKGGVNKSQNEDDEEEKRILYVAMTRAKEYLILSKENSSTSSRKGRWYEFLESSGYIANGEWKVPGEVKDLVEILKLNPLTLTKKEEKGGTDFELDEMLLENPPVESKKSFFSATELFENFNAEPDPMITARGNIAHSILERVGETTLKVALTERIVLPYPARMIEEVKENLEKLTNDELIREIENASQVKSEFAIEGALPALGINVTGKIDKIVKTDCGNKIIDFKYSYEKDKVSDYEFQVMLYAYLYRKLTDLNVCGVIFFLKDGSKLSVETFDEDKLMEEVKRRVKALQTA
jgi:ATP-dependent exoDNAse (exonuclease V) beta subunit